MDTVNRAEQRGLVQQAALLREMKDVRTIIAHDYAGAQLGEIIANCRDHKPELDVICDRMEAYARALLAAAR